MKKVAAIIGAVLLALVLFLCGFGAGNTSSAAPAPSITVTETVTPPAVLKTTKTTDIGSGTPGAYCATSRLGKQFAKRGVTYTCKGPKPYRWRR